MEPRVMVPVFRALRELEGRAKELPREERLRALSTLLALNRAVLLALEALVLEEIPPLSPEG